MFATIKTVLHLKPMNDVENSIYVTITCTTFQNTQENDEDMSTFLQWPVCMYGSGFNMAGTECWSRIMNSRILPMYWDIALRYSSQS